MATATKSTRADGKNGKLLGARFSENLNSPSDPISILKHVLIGTENIEHLGASFALSQRFFIGWTQLYRMSGNEIEGTVGRKTALPKLKAEIGAEKRTRTSTGFPPQVPETCVSTNFTISA